MTALATLAAVASISTLAAPRAGSSPALPAAVRIEPSSTQSAAVPVHPPPPQSKAVTQVLVDRTHGIDTLTSRSEVRPPAVAVERATKAAALPVTQQALTRGVSRTVASSTPRSIAIAMLGDFGWSTDQFACLDQLWVSESDWNPYAENASSGAYGIPQALPGSKMATAGADWRTNPVTQIRWGLEYIRLSYGSPCGAWYFKLANSWY